MFFIFGGPTVSWKFCKQTVIVLSAMEFELIALDTTCSETEWLKDLLFEFSIMHKLILLISVHTDLRSTIEILIQDKANKKMNKHIQIRLKSVQHLLGKVVLSDFVKSKKNIADPLTKGFLRVWT